MLSSEYMDIGISEFILENSYVLSILPFLFKKQNLEGSFIKNNLYIIQNYF